ncbi:MAG: Rpp14/Pop5 family protein [Methanothrix sp.]
MRSRLPVLRVRRRYMIFELEAEGEIEGQDLMREIQISQRSLFGEIGSAENRLQLISFDGRRGILRFHHSRAEQTRATLASIRSIQGTRTALLVKGVSGTIKSATEKYLPPLSKINSDCDRRRIELKEVSGCIVRTHGLQVDLCPDDSEWAKGSDTRYLGLTSFDLCGGHEDADGTTDGL